MEPRLKQCYEVTLPKSENTARHVYVNPQGIRLSSRATSEDKNQVLREISTLLATNANYYVERITSRREGCTVQFLDLSQKPPQYQQKLLGWTELKDNPKAIITQHSLHSTVQSAVSSAIKTAVRQRDFVSAIAALKHKDQAKKAAEEKVRLREEARINGEMEVLLEKAVRAAEEKAKQDAEAKLIADIAAGKEFFKFDPAENKVKGVAKDYEEAKFTDRLKKLQAEKNKTTADYLDTIPLEKEKFSTRINKENTEKLAKLKKRELAITEKLEQHLPKIASAQLAAESAFETAYNRYDQSIVSQQRKILLDAINDYKKTPYWNRDAVRTLALALRIDPKNIRFDHAAGDFYNALQKKNREEIAELFLVMDRSLGSKVEGKEKYKDHPFIPLFKAAYVREQKKLSEDAVKKDVAESLSSLRTTAEEQITGMHKEIVQEFAAYEVSLAAYARFIAKERDDFIAIQELLATAKEQAITASDKSMSEFSRLTTSIEKMQKQASVLQAEIAEKEQEFKLPASDQGGMERFAQLIQHALGIIKKEEASFIREQEQLPVKLDQTDISLEQAKQAVSNKQKQQMSSLQASQQQEKMAKAALQEIQSRHDLVLVKAAAEAERIAMREKLYNTLETMLIDQVDYWKKQQSIIGGSNVLENSGKKTNVPTGIGEMIKTIDERRKPLVDNEKNQRAVSAASLKIMQNPFLL